MSTQVLKNSFKSLSCLGRKHQFPRNFLCWQAPRYNLSNLWPLYCTIIKKSAVPLKEGVEGKRIYLFSGAHYSVGEPQIFEFS
jgi:hypothetical protein